MIYFRHCVQLFHALKENGFKSCGFFSFLAARRLLRIQDKTRGCVDRADTLLHCINMLHMAKRVSNHDIESLGREHAGSVVASRHSVRGRAWGEWVGAGSR